MPHLTYKLPCISTVNSPNLCFPVKDALMEALEKRAIVWPEGWKKDIVDLCSSFSSYSEELKIANESQQSRQLQLYPSREVRIFYFLSFKYFMIKVCFK